MPDDAVTSAAGSSRQAAAERAPATNRRSIIGRVLGDRYGVTALIGEGGTGEIYEAEHLTTARLVAVKVLSARSAHDPEASARLRHEARVVGALGHPNICPVYDLGRLDDGSPYLVMERLHGETLAQHLRRKGRLLVPEVVDVMVQVLSALAAAHERGIIHRDLKPDNVFLAHRSGARPIPKLLDFSISKSADTEETLADISGQALAAGTPFYMAPEQARGDRRLDHRVDLWAAGVVLYECASGRRPFDARNYNALLVEILSAHERPLRELVPDAPEALVRIVERSLRKVAQERFQSAVEMQSALRGVRAFELGIVKGPSSRRSAGSDPGTDDPDGTFVFSRAAMGIRDPETRPGKELVDRTSKAGPMSVPDRAREALHTDETPRQHEPGEEAEDRTLVDEPRFVRDSSGGISSRDTVPTPTRKQ